MGSDAASPKWLEPGVVFAFRGGTEKVLRIGATTIETVDADRFATWSTDQFILAAAAGESVRRADDRRIRRPGTAAPSTTRLTGARAADRFLSFSHEIGGGDLVMAHHVLRWVQAIRTGGDAEPLQHVIGLALVDLGAECFGHGAAVAFPTGKGRRSKRQADAMETQHLIRRFDQFIAGGEPISPKEWGWLRYLLEVGMAAVGMMPRPLTRPPGRPTILSSYARRIDADVQAGLLAAHRGGLARAIRDAARDEVLLKRQVGAAWRNQDHTQISVADDDSDVEARAKAIEGHYHVIKRRAAGKE